MIRNIINSIDILNETIGRAASWLVLAMVLLICYDVTMRYSFHQGSVALQELEWHLFALIFLLGSAYTLKHNNHVRVGMLYQSQYLSNKHRAMINILGIILFLIPFCVLILITTWPFVENAYYYLEGSPDPGGLPYRYLLKGSILVAFTLLILQGVAELLRNYLILTKQDPS